MVRVRVVAGLVAVWMPKSSSLGEKTMGVGWRVMVGRVAVWVVALGLATVRVPGLESGEGDAAFGSGGEGGGAVGVRW